VISYADVQLPSPTPAQIAWVQAHVPFDWSAEFLSRGQPSTRLTTVKISGLSGHGEDAIRVLRTTGPVALSVRACCAGRRGEPRGSPRPTTCATRRPWQPFTALVGAWTFSRCSSTTAPAAFRRICGFSLPGR
jgi:hypothetical protein